MTLTGKTLLAAAVAAAALTGLAASAQAQRDPAYAAARASGQVGEQTNGYLPKVIVEEKGGLIIVEESEKSIRTVLEVFTDMMKISYLSEQFGGPHFMSDEQISFIDNWEVENYRRSVAKR